MNAFNRILVVLIVLLTIGSAVLAVILYQNRNLMRDRADTMAESLVEMVTQLDRESRTDVSDDVTFRPRDEEAGLPDSGTLSWRQYLEERPDFNTLNEAVEAAETLADDINRQRNHLAETLAEAAQNLGAEDGLARILSNAADPEVYESQAQSIIRLVEAVRDRTSDMVDTYVEIADVANVDIDREDFFQRREERDAEGDLIETDFLHASVLREIGEGVESLRDARDAYQDGLIAAIREIEEHDWSVSEAQLRDEARYERALTSMENDFDEINDELIRSAQRREAIAELDEELEATEESLMEVVAERDRMQERLRELGDEIERLHPDDRPITEVDPDVDVQEYFPRNETGLVLEVNERFGFVIIDLGYSDKANVGLELLVERDGDFVARIELVEAGRDFAIADVIPRIMVGEIEAGDRVISP